MAAGQPTDDAVKSAFAADYLLTGNASKSARNVRRLLGTDMSDRTGRDLAGVLDEDPDFIDLRSKQHARFLSEAIASRQDMLRLASKRAKAKSPQVFHFGESGTVLDKRSDWAKVVLEAEKNAHNLVKVIAAAGGGEVKPVEVNITVVGPTAQLPEKSVDGAQS